MANVSFLKLTTILSLLLIPLALHHSQTMAFSIETEDTEEEDYVLDHSSPGFGLRSRSLASMIVKKGTCCDPNIAFNICNGVSANKGKGLLFCCKKHCCNVLSDKNNCGQCEHKCKQGQPCCNGVCTNVFFNAHHCGKCNKKCSLGVACENGFCGYA